MLINKGVTVGEVVTIKTTAGEEIVAKLVEENPTMVTVSKPLVLTAGQKGIALVPFLFTTDPDADISISRGSRRPCRNLEKQKKINCARDRRRWHNPGEV